MSVLTSTRTGYKYYYGKDVLNGYCKMLLHGEEIELITEINSNKQISILIPEQIQYRLMTQTVQKNDSTKWLFNEEDAPFKMFHFIQPNIDYEFVIEKDFTEDKCVQFEQIQMPIVINCKMSDLSCFNNCKINGYIKTDIYSYNDLMEHHITPYYGKEVLGF